MNHYCTYFDRGFLIQGLALARSLATREPGSRLWVLALDDFTADVLREIGGGQIQVVRLAEIERSDPELLAAKANRTRVEYYFTLSPCWPRWLLAQYPEIERLTYVDADMLFFASGEAIFAAMDQARASVLVTEHRFPSWQRHYERHGRFNVGILSFRNDGAGRRCLDEWRADCIAWCHDRLEDGKYADQKYLDRWPSRLGPALLVLDHPGVNLAPWNWRRHRIEIIDAATPPAKGAVRVDGQPLVLFHFARFRLLRGRRWQSGQLNYGVMPGRLRDAIYGPYVQALLAAQTEIVAGHPDAVLPRRSARLGHDFWRELPLRLVFGGNWLRVGDRFFNFRLGLGRWSGQSCAKLRTIFFRP